MLIQLIQDVNLGRSVNTYTVIIEHNVSVYMDSSAPSTSFYQLEYRELESKTLFLVIELTEPCHLNIRRFMYV